MRILIVQDVGDISSVLASRLSARGHSLVQGSLEIDSPVSHRKDDAVVLNLELPNRHWLDTLRRFRRVSQVPVLVWAARGDEYPGVRWLHGGADDYVRKPAQVQELVTRIETLRRAPRVRESAPPSPVKTMGASIDLETRTVEVNGIRPELTNTEFGILAVLARHAGRPVSRQQIVAEVWSGRVRPTSRALDAHMNNLRKKLVLPGLIATLYGYGYRLGVS